LGFDFTIEYKRRKDNQAAYALSRVFFAISTPQFEFLNTLRQELEGYDPLLHIPAITVDSHSLVKQDGLWFWKGKLVIPSTSHIKQLLIKEFHDSPMGGHAGIQRTLARITAQFVWKGINHDIKEYVRSCSICQQAKYVTHPPAGLLQPLQIPTQIWQDIAMDFITGLPLSHGYSVIMVVIDRLSKFAYFIPLPARHNAQMVAEVLTHNVLKFHGIPHSIVSDRDKIFTSTFWQHLFKFQGTTLAMSSSYHPQTDGQSEVLNHCLEMYMRCFTQQNPKSWYKLLPWAAYWYNIAFHSAIGMTPYRAVFGCDPPKILRYNPNPSDEPTVRQQLQERDNIMTQLKVDLDRAQQRMKAYADGKRKDVQFSKGDYVFVKLQPYRQNSVAFSRNQKLRMKYFGSFKILERVGQVAYKLELPTTARIHPVFHISILKKCLGDPQQ